MAILALALITAAIVAGFSATSAETVANNAVRAQNRAYQMAEAALQTFIMRRSEAGWCTNCVNDPAVADSEWSTVSMVGGYARVVALRVRPKLADGSPALFYIISTGTDTMARLSGAGSTQYASRSVGTYATFNTPGIKALAAWVSLSGITNSGTGSQSPVMGSDECGGSTIAGLTVPSGGQYSGSGPKPTGSPNTDSTMSLDSIKKRIGIDWNAIVNNEAIPADISIGTGSFPSALFFLIDTSYWPVIHIRKNYTIPNDGRGIIIADSNLSFTSNRTWDGIVLVGGKLTSTGSDTTFGVVISGLNLTLPGAVNPPSGTTTDNDVLSNTKRFRYNSCKAARAAERLKIYFALSNAWSDNVAVW